MTDEELIARLRMIHEWKVGNAAADRIEALVRESAEMEAEAHAHIELWGAALREKAAVEERAEQMEAALRKIGKTYPADNMRLIHGELHIMNIVNSALKGADHV